jgi:four helix bundle protein
MFAMRVLKFVRSLPCDPVVDGILRQLTRSAPGEAANYRAARRARSRREFVAKMGVVAEEADETEYWLELLDQLAMARGSELDGLVAESRQLRAIFVASAATARANLTESKIPRSLDP